MSEIDYSPYHKILASRGYTANDFDLAVEEYTDYMPSAVCRPYTLPESRLRISIRNKHTGKSRNYAGERLSDWAVDFETDLQNGVFD